MSSGDIGDDDLRIFDISFEISKAIGDLRFCLASIEFFLILLSSNFLLKNDEFLNSELLDLS